MNIVKDVRKYTEYLTPQDIELIYLAVIYLIDNVDDAENQLNVEINKNQVDVLLAKLELDHNYLADKI